MTPLQESKAVIYQYRIVVLGEREDGTPYNGGEDQELPWEPRRAMVAERARDLIVDGLKLRFQRRSVTYGEPEEMGVV